MSCIHAETRARQDPGISFNNFSRAALSGSREPRRRRRSGPAPPREGRRRRLRRVCARARATLCVRRYGAGAGYNVAKEVVVPARPRPSVSELFCRRRARVWLHHRSASPSGRRRRRAERTRAPGSARAKLAQNSACSRSRALQSARRLFN